MSTRLDKLIGARSSSAITMAGSHEEPSSIMMIARGSHKEPGEIMKSVAGSFLEHYKHLCYNSIWFHVRTNTGRRHERRICIGPASS